MPRRVRATWIRRILTQGASRGTHRRNGPATSVRRHRVAHQLVYLVSRIRVRHQTVQCQTMMMNWTYTYTVGILMCQHWAALAVRTFTPGLMKPVSDGQHR